MSKKEIKKIVLAYSGGLDTSIIIPWLKENYNNPEIIAVAADVGQGDELDGIEEKALETGAAKIRVEDLADLMVDEVIIPSMMMGAKYEDYLLGTAFARPVIARRLLFPKIRPGPAGTEYICTRPFKNTGKIRGDCEDCPYGPEYPGIIMHFSILKCRGRESILTYKTSRKGCWQEGNGGNHND